MKKLSQAHKEAIARYRRGRRHKPATKAKISKELEGTSNFEGKKHTRTAKTRISIKRGSYDPIKEKRWIVNSTNKTYRRYSAPSGYKLGRRTFREFLEANILRDI